MNEERKAKRLARKLAKAKTAVGSGDGGRVDQARSERINAKLTRQEASAVKRRQRRAERKAGKAQAENEGDAR